MSFGKDHTVVVGGDASPGMPGNSPLIAPKVSTRQTDLRFADID